jgi:hypothetical protein
MIGRVARPRASLLLRRPPECQCKEGVSLRSAKKIEELSIASLEKSALPLIEVQVGDIVAKVRYGSKYSIEHDYPIEWWPYIEIDLANGVSLQDYLLHVACITQFFGLALGIYLHPKEIDISRFSEAEIFAALERDRFSPVHSVEYIWPKHEIDEIQVWHGNSFVGAWDEQELSALMSCLRKWIERAPEWRKVYSLAMQSLLLMNEVTWKRLLAAWRWFEEIPAAKILPSITDQDLQKIATKAALGAKELGYVNLEKRILGALRNIRSESNVQRFERVIAAVNAKFGAKILGDGILDCLMSAVAFRGRSAHGDFYPDSDDEFGRFAKSIYAMEALCFLLTILDFPTSNEALGRVSGNPLVASYRHS